MDLTFIGSGSAFNPDMENSNAFFTLGDRFYLIDCGETAFGRIWNLPELRSSRQVTVAVTHLHCDHVGSLGSLISYSFFVLRKKIRVYHPLDTVVRLLDLMGIDRANYTYLDRLEEGEAEPVSFTPLQVEHVENMTCFGYIVSAPSGRIYFSGDAKGIPDAVLTGFRKGEIDRIYQDTSIEASDHPTHGTLRDLENIFPPETRGRVFCMHLDTDYREILREKGFGVVKTLA